jgi:transcription initiation factor TFIID TATA-box-binding protein
MPEVVNIVASGTLGRELNIRAVGEDIDADEVKSQTGEYKTPTAYIREREDGPLVTVYESGSYHISGAESIEDAEKTRDWFVGELERLGIKRVDSTFAVKNVVVVGDLGENLDLNALAIRFGLERVEYEPEQFPGMVFRPDERDSVFLIFSSGRVVIPGSSSSEMGFEAFDWLVAQISAEPQT